MRRKNQGFALSGIVVGIIAVGLVGLIGWRVYQANTQTSKPLTQNDTRDKAKPNQSQATNPYTSWKTYCDDSYKMCFRYPVDWQTTPNSDVDFVSLGLKSADSQLLGTYVNYDTRDGHDMPFYTASLEDLSVSNEKYKVVGGFVVSGDIFYPSYRVVDTSLTTQLKINSESDLVNTARFTLKDSLLGTFSVYPKTDGFSYGQAKAWFQTEDAKTAALVVKSLQQK